MAVRFVIRKTFGASRTYLNQIFLMESLCSSTDSPEEQSTPATVQSNNPPIPEACSSVQEEREDQEPIRTMKSIQHDMRRIALTSNRPSTSLGFASREARNSYSSSPGPISSRFSRHSDSEAAGVLLANKLQAMQHTILALCQQTKEEQTQLSLLQKSLQEGESARKGD